MNFQGHTHIIGRGMLIRAQLQKGEPFPQKGMRVEYQGKLYEIVGVEGRVSNTYPPTTSRQVGLIVREVADGS